MRAHETRVIFLSGVLCLVVCLGRSERYQEYHRRQTDLPITTNLAAVLKVLAETFDNEQVPRYPFLVDAVCINQSDLLERSEQVQLMGNIFRSAKGVIGWLGPEDDRSTVAIELMKHIAEEVKSSAQGDMNFLLKPAPRPLMERSNMGSLKESPFPNDILPDDSLASLVVARGRQICNLFRRTFWKRTWILQELVLAKRVLFLCGRADFTYDDILANFNWASKIPFDASPSTVSQQEWIKFQPDLTSALSVAARAFILKGPLDEIISSEEPYSERSSFSLSHDIWLHLILGIRYTVY